MPGGGKQPGAGRPKGLKNKATIEREKAAALAAERARLMEETAAAEVKQAVIEARASGVKLAKEVLQDLMRFAMSMTAKHQPLPAGIPVQEGREPNVKEFREWLTITHAIAKDLAPYESPRLSAMMVGAAVVTEVEIKGGLPDEFDGGLQDKPKVIDATPEPTDLPKAVNE